MAKRSEIPALLISLLVTVGLLVGLGYFGWRFFREQNGLTGANSGTVSPQSSSASNAPQSTGSGAASPRFSTGQQSLFADSLSPTKQAGIAALAAGNFDQAVSQLEASLRENRNDPEALIYLNNARIGDARALTIAAVVPIESAENPARELLRGIAQAQAEVNEAGGIQGTPLRVVIAADSSEPEAVTEVAKGLVAMPEVLAAVGHFSSGATLAAEPVYTEAQLPVISPTSTSVSISGVSDYVFRTVPSDRFAAAALARYMLGDLQKQRVAVFFNSESSYSTSLKDEFTTAVFGEGGQVLTEFDLISPDFNAGQALAQLQAQQPDVIMLAANTATLDQALDVIAANAGQLALLGGDSLYNPRVLEVGGAAAEELVVAIPWHLLAYTQSPFVEWSQLLWGGDVNWRTAMAYDAAKALTTALETLPDPSRETLQQALSSPGFQAEGATSAVNFLPSGDRNQAAQLVVVQPGSRSGHGYDFAPMSQQAE